MFTWIGAQFSRVLDGYVLSVVATLSAALAPVALTTMTLWVSLYGWAIVRGEVQEPIPAFLWKTFKIGLVLVLALQSGVYASNVADSATALSTGVASTFLTSGADPKALGSPYALLDTFNDQASQLTLDLLREAGITRLDLLLAAVACSLGNVAFLCVGLYLVTLVKVLQTFILAVGPVFILCLAWRPTARFFDSWLSMLLNCVVLTWFACFALGLSLYLGQAILQAAQDHGGFLGDTFNVVAESLRYCVVMVLMAIICFQAPSLASALTGGAAVQQGIQMIQNVLMVSGRRSTAAAGSLPAAGAQGGTVRAGAGVAYGMGRITARAASSASGASAAAHRGYATARTAVYRMAALRGLS